MITPEFQDLLLSGNAVLNDSAAVSDSAVEVASFGDSVAEFEASKSEVALIVLSDLIRIRLTGADRVKFLHNFCTGNVKAMAIGDVVEAFLTDVKARVLGHGYIATFGESVELWMLPGNADAVAKHLQKYVIVEDVDVQIIEPTIALALAGPKAAGIYAEWQNGTELESGKCADAEAYSVISVEWNGQPLLLLSLTSNDWAMDAWQALKSVGTIAAGQLAFEAIRIAERFPRVDVDLSNSNMAPEAGRNDTAICYTKGCYLGQEPIARLDAMGHVNRQLYSGTIQPYHNEIPEDTKKWPLVTSMASLSDDLAVALGVLPVKSATAGEPVACRTADGRFWEFTVAGGAGK